MLFRSVRRSSWSPIIEEPWDPGHPLSGMVNKMNIIKEDLALRLPTACGSIWLQGHSVHQLFSCNVVVETIMNWMAKLVKLQLWPSWVLSWMVVFMHMQAHSSWELSVLILKMAIRARYTAWTWCYLDTLHYIHGSTNLAISHWDMHIISSETWVLIDRKSVV